MCISLPNDKLEKLRWYTWHKFHEHRKQFSVIEGAEFLGFLEQISSFFSWFKQVFFNIRESYNMALRISNINFNLTEEYTQAVLQAESYEGAERIHLLKFIAKQRARALFNSSINQQINITNDFRNDINLISALASDSKFWSTTIPHIIPRCPTFTAFCDSYNYGAGGFSYELGFVWHMFWADKHTASPQVPFIDEPSEAHINYASTSLSL